LLSWLSCLVLFYVSGYRLFKGTMFTTGFIFGSSILYFVCFKFEVLPFGGRIGLSVGAGLLCGLTAIFVYYIGLFVVGFNFGFLLAVSGLVIVEQFYHPFTEWIPIGVILGIAVVCALLVSIVIACCGVFCFLTSTVLSLKRKFMLQFILSYVIPVGQKEDFSSTEFIN